LVFDLGEEPAQGLRIPGISGQNLIGERQTFRRHDERDHDLDAVKAVVAAVAVSALDLLIERRIGVKDSK
jgi:hypothetical protein